MKKQRILQIVFAVLGAALIVFVMTRQPKQPTLPRLEIQEKLIQNAEIQAKAHAQKSADAELVKMLLKEDLSDRTFDFSVVAEAASGKKVIPMEKMKSSERVKALITKAVDQLLVEMNQEGSPIKGLRRINEGSKFFEDGLQKQLDAAEGLRCEFPKTRAGEMQRSGYPDLVITDELTGEVYYLDPKLLEQGSVKSSLRTFYFEPKDETLKITQDAAHLIVGIEHDGVDGNWKFTGYRLVDLYFLKVSLKAEFQAPNQDVYSERSVLDTRSASGKDGVR
ncbi:MAG: hypothetical protein V4727_05320 [Verrucomicrobiota bacterium]